MVNQNQKLFFVIAGFSSIVIFFSCLPVPVLAQKLSFSPSRHTIIGVPQIHQGRNECGPVSVAMVLNYWGVKKNKDKLKEPLRWDSEKGVHPINMIRFSYNAGYKYDSPEEGSIERIIEHIVQGRPVIVRQWLNYDAKNKADIGHYRVVIGYDHERQEIYMRDPAIRTGRFSSLSYKEFLELWDLSNHAKTSSKNWMLVLIPEK